MHDLDKAFKDIFNTDQPFHVEKKREPISQVSSSTVRLPDSRIAVAEITGRDAASTNVSYGSRQ